MDTRLWRLAVLAAVTLVGACSAPEYWRTDVDQETGAGTAFEENLRTGYTDSAIRSTGGTNWPHAAAYAKKAAHAKVAYPTWPDHPDQHKLPVETLRPLEHYYNRMERTLHYGADNIAPDAAADMQVAWDCWLRDVVHDRALEPTTRCGANFMNALEVVEAACNARLEEVCGPPPPMRSPEPVALDAKAFIVYFGFDSSVLGSEALGIIRDAADYASGPGYSRIQLSGHADRSGNVDYNMGLSQRRVGAVQAELIRLGVSPASIGTDWRGESLNRVDTADGIREGENRRVEILVE